MNGNLVVAKVGGSLFDWPDLPRKLEAFLADREASGDRVVLLAGGGDAANFVREFDATFGLGEAVAHDQAVKSLDLSAEALACLVRQSAVVTTREEVLATFAAGLQPILAPRILLELDKRSADPLPRCWETTADAIAARVAAMLGAAEVVLLKSTDFPPGISFREAADLGLVDRVFPTVIDGLKATITNLRR
jgi:aspartokinase-like uncharacterized kinase